MRTLQECIIALARARKRSANSVAEVNRLHGKLPRNLPQTEADRVRVVAELDAVYVRAIADAQAEREAALRTSRTLEYLAQRDGGSGRYSALPPMPRADDDDASEALGGTVGAEEEDGLPPPVPFASARGPDEESEASEAEFGGQSSRAIAQPAHEEGSEMGEVEGSELGEEGEGEGDDGDDAADSVARGTEDDDAEGGSEREDGELASELASELDDDESVAAPEEGDNAVDEYDDDAHLLQSLEGSDMEDADEEVDGGGEDESVAADSASNLDDVEDSESALGDGVDGSEGEEADGEEADGEDEDGEAEGDGEGEGEEEDEG